MNAYSHFDPPPQTALVFQSHKQRRHEMTDFLMNSHYRVLTSNSSAEALDFCRDFGGAIHVLVTDVDVRCNMGWEFAAEVAKLRPGIVVLFVPTASIDTAMLPKSKPAPHATDPEFLLNITRTLSQLGQRKMRRN